MDLKTALEMSPNTNVGASTLLMTLHISHITTWFHIFQI